MDILDTMNCIDAGLMEQCSHCNGYGSSLKDPIGVDTCSVCKGSGAVPVPSGPATRFQLAVSHGKVIARYRGTTGGSVSRTVTSIDDLRDFMRSKANEARVTRLKVHFGNSLCYANVHTNDPDVIELATLILMDEWNEWR